MKRLRHVFAKARRPALVCPGLERLALLAGGFVLVVTPACSTFDPNAPYTLVGGLEEEPTAIPDGTPIIEHHPVAIDERSARIELVEDLVLDRGEEPFYRIGAVDTDRDGNILVHDSGYQHVDAFDAAGRYLRTFGRPGQGPGELTQGGDLAAGDGVVWTSRKRINLWSADGEVRVSRDVGFTNFLRSIEGTDQGHFVAMARTRTPTGFRQSVVAIDADGYRTVIYADLPRSRQLMVAQGSRAVSTRLPRPRPSFALSRSGHVYVTTGVEYDVLALDADGAPRWALRVPWPRIELTDEDIDRALAHVMGRGDDNDIPSGLDDVRRSDVEWPEALPALIGASSAFQRLRPQPIRVDGHGHLYVFPLIPDDWNRPEQPVDVYSVEGEHLFAGMIPMIRWDSARGDSVYGTRTDPQTEEQVVVRYRLVEPFEGR